MAMRLEPGKTPGFGFVAVDGEGVIVPPARMGDVVDASTNRATGPVVIDVECQRRIDRQDRMQCGCGLPALKRTPPTLSPLVSVRAIGTGRRLHMMR
jgi:hypothetical protein